MTVVRITTHKTNSGINEHWTAVSKELLNTEFAKELANFPEFGYGTSMTNVRMDPTGMLYHADFYRQLSCD